MKKLNGGKGVDYVVECSAATSAVNDAVRMVNRGGRVCLAAFAHEEVPVDVAHIVRNNIYLYGIRGEGKSATHRAEAFMQQKRFDATKIHTHTFPLDDLPTAIRYAKDRVEDAIKVVVKAKMDAAQKEAAEDLNPRMKGDEGWMLTCDDYLTPGSLDEAIRDDGVPSRPLSHHRGCNRYIAMGPRRPCGRCPHSGIDRRIENSRASRDIRRRQASPAWSRNADPALSRQHRALPVPCQPCRVARCGLRTTRSARRRRSVEIS